MNNGVMDAIIERVLMEEGGVKDAQDGKGLTRWGQTPEWLKTWSFPIPQTRYEAKENYRLWLVRTGLIHLCSVDDALPNLVIDWAVHSGHVTAVKALQRSLKVADDGIIGAQTKAAIAAANRRQVAAEVFGSRIRFVGTIVKSRPLYVAENWGWFNRLGTQAEWLGR